MLRIVIDVNAPPGRAIGVKEDLAMYLERFGDARVVSVEEIKPEFRQMEIGGISNGARKVQGVRR